MTTLHATRGDDEVYEFTVKRANVVVDISGAVLRFTARLGANVADPPIISLITGNGIDITDGPAGKCLVTVPGTATAALDAPIRLVYDLELDLGASGKSTVATGLLYVNADVTH